MVYPGEHWHSEGHRHWVVAPRWAEDAQFQWFDPQAWGASARPVADGGRGAAWFLHGDRGDWVLRHYRRGGLPAKLMRQRYLFIGRDRVRSVREFRLLAQLHAQQLPVPEPVGAYYERLGPTYRAALIVTQLTGTCSLLSRQREEDLPLWQAAGRCIRRFHDAGVEHADLNATNILVRPDSGEVFLIDFDRGHQHHRHTAAAGWKADNLTRLERGVYKHWPGGARHSPAPLLQALRQGYS